MDCEGNHEGDLEETEKGLLEVNGKEDSLRTQFDRWKYVELFRATIAEFMATMLLVLLVILAFFDPAPKLTCTQKGCGMVIVNGGEQIVVSAVGFGTLVAVLIYAFEPHSGAIFNPAVCKLRKSTSFLIN